MEVAENAVNEDRSKQLAFGTRDSILNDSPREGFSAKLDMKYMTTRYE